MLYEPLLAQQMAKEQVRDNLREAERTHLIQVAEDAKKSRRWRLPSLPSFRDLLALVTRPGCKPLRLKPGEEASNGR